MSATDHNNDANDNNDNNDHSRSTRPRLTGRVKWFNNKTGFGFISALTDSEGIKEGSDVFVHHSAVKVSQEQYRYLVQGEYVEFVLSKLKPSDASADASDSKHEFQAIDVSGVKGGKLICETRWESRTSSGAGFSSSGSGGASRFKRADDAPSEWTTVGGSRKSSAFVPRQEWRVGSRGRGGKGATE